MEPLVLPPRLRTLADQQLGLFTREQATRHGVPSALLDRHRRARQLTAVRRGVYLVGDDAELEERHRHLVHAFARVLVTLGDAVISHESAALVHRFLLLHDAPRIPTLTVARPVGASPLRLHALYTCAVPAEHRVVLGSRVTLTSRERTVADCCRGRDGDAGLVLADSALRLGVAREAVLAVLDTCKGWPGAAAARELVLFADGRAESALESLARRWFAEQGLPPPEPQVTLAGRGGRFLGRVDFFWPEHRTVCEVDGRVKYDGQQRGRRDPLWQEKRREDGLRDHGAEVVRGYWSDGEDRGADLAGRLRAAFARAAERTDPPQYYRPARTSSA